MDRRTMSTNELLALYSDVMRIADDVVRQAPVPPFERLRIAENQLGIVTPPTRRHVWLSGALAIPYLLLRPIRLLRLLFLPLCFFGLGVDLSLRHLAAHLSGIQLLRSITFLAAVLSIDVMRRSAQIQLGIRGRRWLATDIRLMLLVAPAGAAASGAVFWSLQTYHLLRLTRPPATPAEIGWPAVGAVLSLAALSPLLIHIAGVVAQRSSGFLSTIRRSWRWWFTPVCVAVGALWPIYFALEDRYWTDYLPQLEGLDWRDHLALDLSVHVSVIWLSFAAFGIGLSKLDRAT